MKNSTNKQIIFLTGYLHLLKNRISSLDMVDLSRNNAMLNFSYIHVEHSCYLIKIINGALECIRYKLYRYSPSVANKMHEDFFKFIFHYLLQSFVNEHLKKKMKCCRRYYYTEESDGNNVTNFIFVR